MDYIRQFEQLSHRDVGLVGGKNSSLGEMICNLNGQGVKVPPGFATTTHAYWEYIESNNIRPEMTRLIRTWQSGSVDLAETGQRLRGLFLRGTWPGDLESAIISAYRNLCVRANVDNVSVAVRSSATAEDLPEASFAGQQDSFLNVEGPEQILSACKRCYASLFTDRAIAYREKQGFDHAAVALSVGLQCMVRSDIGSSGVMFSLDTETGFDKIVLINASWGLGETIVQGTVDPDEYRVFKPLVNNFNLRPVLERRSGSKLVKMVYGDEHTRTLTTATTRSEKKAVVLSDAEILKLARWACPVEEHYGQPMDMEWAKDGITEELFMVQARPETVHSRIRPCLTLKTYKVEATGQLLVTGLAVGEAAVAGRVCLIDSPRDTAKFTDNSVLVAKATDPDWVPLMKRAAAIVTDHGGRTSHAAIVSRELGLPAIVGTGNGTFVLHTGQDVTVSCADGSCGFVYNGLSDIQAEHIDLSQLYKTRTLVMLNLGNPAAAFRWWRLPVDGIGLVRMEFVVSSSIKVHPMALVNFDRLQDLEAKRQISRLTSAYKDKPEYFVDKLTEAFSVLCAAVFPRPAIVRMSDFKTNEYAGLMGGAEFEVTENNPMIGFRGASRYYSEAYKQGFALECRAIKRLREEVGLTNAIVMIPVCRTIEEAKNVLDILAENGLGRGQNGLQVYMMCELPSNAILADKFLEHFDGFSVGSNDLTQLTLGVDRDSTELAGMFDEQDDAVKWMTHRVIGAGLKRGSKIGICGQAPSDHPDFVNFLVGEGITSISVSPDSFVAVKRAVIAKEAETLELPR